MLAKNIKNLRKNKGMTQEELAIRLNVVRQTVSKWEKELSVPDADLLEKLADILETDVSTLLGEKIELKSDSNEIAVQLARLNEHLAIRNKSSRKIWLAIGITLLSIVVLIMAFFLIRWVIGLTDNPMSSDNIDFESMSNDEYVCITEFDDNSPYLYYRDIFLLDETNEYKIRHNESNDFDFYFAERNYVGQNATVFYPQYMCYIKYNAVFPDNADMTIKYIYDSTNSWETSGEAENELLLLSSALAEMPQEIVITVKENGSKNQNETVILSESFKLYSFK